MSAIFGPYCVDGENVLCKDGNNINPENYQELELYSKKHIE